jgi:hypothetical protein
LPAFSRRQEGNVSFGESVTRLHGIALIRERPIEKPVKDSLYRFRIAHAIEKAVVDEAGDVRTADLHIYTDLVSYRSSNN